MDGARYIGVKLSDGKTIASVRVVSLHPDDDAMWAMRQKVEDTWEHCESIDSLVRGTKSTADIGNGVWVNEPLLDEDRAKKAIDLGVSLKIKYRKELRDLLASALKDNHDGHQSELFRLCGISETLRLWRATAGEDIQHRIDAAEEAEKSRNERLYQIWEQALKAQLTERAKKLTDTPPADTPLPPA